jgi:hypothetical protein
MLDDSEIAFISMMELTGQKPLVVPWSAVDVGQEDGIHVFVRVIVEMMDLVAFVQNIGHG